MAFFPNEITVRLVAANDASVAADNVVVALTTQWHGRNYYTAWIGITDAEGIAHALGPDLQRTFDERQQKYVMDLKVPLAESDPVLIIRVIGGVDFTKLKQQG